VPYGIYDTTLNEGWVSVGSDSETAQFAVNSIGRWWSQPGEWRYPEAGQILIMADCGGSNALLARRVNPLRLQILIMADCGGSNSARGRLWKKCLRQWADQTGLGVTVCHFPPGTSKWNKIEHRMFCQITKNWRGKPLISHEVIIQLIAATTTTTGLRIQSELDPAMYEKGLLVSDSEIAALSIERAAFHGDWNYHFNPRN
jgi:hypothetical protein